jgi:hypothetical protein
MTEIRPAVEDVAAMEEIGRVTWPATYSFAGADYIGNIDLRPGWGESVWMEHSSAPGD